MVRIEMYDVRFQRWMLRGLEGYAAEQVTLQVADLPSKMVIKRGRKTTKLGYKQGDGFLSDSTGRLPPASLTPSCSKPRRQSERMHAHSEHQREAQLQGASPGVAVYLKLVHF